MEMGDQWHAHSLSFRLSCPVQADRKPWEEARAYSDRCVSQTLPQSLQSCLADPRAGNGLLAFILCKVQLRGGLRRGGVKTVSVAFSRNFDYVLDRVMIRMNNVKLCYVIFKVMSLNIW